MHRSYSHTYLSLAVAGVLTATAPVFASLEDELAEDHELSMAFETPHTDWASPYALGKVRLLYFGQGFRSEMSFDGRHLIELMQRFDIEAEAAYFDYRGDYARDNEETRSQRIIKLVEQPWDCFLFDGVAITDLRVEAQYKVLKAVAEGAGLVLIGWDDQRDAKLSQWVSGRAVRMGGRPGIPYRPGWEVDYDYWQERVGREVLSAAGVPPRVHLTIDLESAKLDRVEVLGHTFKISWEKGGASPEDLRLAVRLRRSDGAAFNLHPAPQNPNTYRFERRHRAGQYHIDVIARSNEGVEAWATVPMEVTASRTIEAIELDKNWGEIGETISGTVQLSGEPLAGEGEKVRVQLLDARQRILVQADRQVTDSAAGFAFGITDWMPMLLEVRAVVMQGEEDVASGFRYFNVTKRHRGRFNFIVWEHANDILAPYAERQLASIGCTVQLWGGEPPPLAAAAQNIAHIPYSTHISTSWDENGHMLPMCWNNEPDVDEWVDGVVSRRQGSRQHGVFVYSLGDEVTTKGSCVHPACLSAYRRYLQQEYGDVGSLNKSWGTDYAGFDQVNLLVTGDNDETESFRRKVYSRWYDRQAFKAYNLVRLCERFGHRFKEMDPQARTGFEGAGRFADGTDLDLICRTNEFWSPYPGLHDEVIRSIASRDFIRSNWMGYQKDAESLLHQYWRMVTRGTDSVWFWMMNGFGRYRGLLAPHMAPWRAIQEIYRDTQIVRDGLGDLLLKWRRDDDGIAILYSFPSTFANRFGNGPSYGTYEAGHQAWHTTLRALGLEFSYVTDRMLRRDEFQSGRYKVLILPQTEAISPQAAQVIRNFAEGGGTVIADVRPGIYDGHCKPLEIGVLDVLFGIERTSDQAALVTEAHIRGVPGGRAVNLSFEKAKADPAVRLTSGQSGDCAEGTPLCIVNHVGQGQTVLLNFSLDSFPRINNTEKAPPEAAEFASALLAFAGVEPEVTVTDLGDNAIRDTQVIRWKGDGLDFLALFGGKEEWVQVHLPRHRFVYDLREHAYLGHTTTFNARKMPNRATFIVLSTRRLSRPQINVARTTPAGEPLTIDLSYPDSQAYHAARLRVHYPDGRLAEAFDQVVIIGPQGARITLPIAYNDPAGLWTVQATDLYTNETAMTGFSVE